MYFRTVLSLRSDWCTQCQPWLLCTSLSAALYRCKKSAGSRTLSERPLSVTPLSATLCRWHCFFENRGQNETAGICSGSGYRSPATKRGQTARFTDVACGILSQRIHRRLLYRTAETNVRRSAERRCHCCQLCFAEAGRTGEKASCSPAAHNGGNGHSGAAGFSDCNFTRWHIGNCSRCTAGIGEKQALRCSIFRAAAWKTRKHCLPAGQSDRNL